MTFPAYRPTDLSLEHGTYPASVTQTISGRTAILRHSDVETDIGLTREFVLTQAQFLDVLQHYQANGTVVSFDLPSEVEAGFTPEGFRWRYSSEPVGVQDEHKDFFRVSCTFIGNLWADIRLPQGTGILRLAGVEAAISDVLTVAPGAPTATVQGLASGVTPDGFVEVTGLEPGTSWEYSTNGGSSWTAGTGSGFQLAAGSYSTGAIRVRQEDRDGNTSTPAQNASAITVAPPSSAVVAFTASAGATTTGTVTLPLVARLVRFSMNHPGWFTLYASVAARSADSSRPATVMPARGVGVCADPRLAAGGVINLNAFADIRNEESPATTTYPWKHVNEDTVSRDCVIILTIITS